MNTKWLRYGAFALIALVVLVGFGAWFWSLGAVAGETASVIQLVVKKAPVEVRAPSDAAWTSVEHSTELVPGTQVRTGNGAEAQILWGDRGVTRLDANTQITVEAMPVDAEQSTGVTIKIRVEAGRVWSRMLKLLDIQSSFDVETRDVVATVRGTAFGVGVTSAATEAAVTRSVVELRSKDKLRSTLLREGEWGSFDGRGAPTVVRPLVESDAWATMNAERDRLFEQELLAEQRARMKRLAGAQIIGPDWLVNLSEDLRMGIIGPVDRPELAEQYMMRQLGRYLENGDADHLERIVELSRTPEVRSGRVLGAIRVVLDTGVSSSLELRELRGILLAPSPSGVWYAEALNVDDDIDTLLSSDVDGSSRAALHEAATASLEELERWALVISDMGAAAEIDQTIPLEVRDKPAALSKLQALRRRLELVDSIRPPQESETGGTETSDETGTTPVSRPAPVITTPPTQPTTVSRPYQRLTLLVSPTQTDIGSAVRVTLYGIRADGTAADLTSQASIYPADSRTGTYAKGLFTPLVSGSITLTAQYKDAQGSRTTSASLMVRAPQPTSNLEGIGFQFVGPTTVPCSSTIPFKVMAYYVDGTTKDVTAAAVVSVQNTKLFGVTDGKFLSYCAATAESTTVMASYTEGGTTKTASAKVALEPDPAPVTAPPQGFNPNLQ